MIFALEFAKVWRIGAAYIDTEVISVTGHDCKVHLIPKREGILGRVKSKSQVRKEVFDALGEGNNTAYIELFNYVGETSNLRHLKGFKVDSPLFAHIRSRSLEQDISME